MIKKIKNSLTIKVFFITAFLLSFACCITFYCISRMLPSTYTTMLNQDLSVQAVSLTSQMASAVQIQDCYSVLAEFEQSADGKVRISDVEGTIVYPSDSSTAANKMVVAYDVETAEEGFESVNIESAELEFELLNGESYQLTVIGNAKQINQATAALMKTLPYIVIVILVLSFLCAALYSWYITGPVILLCNLSKQMANLDFAQKYKGSRKDEIGLLGNHLNELSKNLSGSLSSLKAANAELKSDMEKEHLLEQQRMEFFAAVSHELKTPITILKGHMNGMLDGVGNYRNHEYYLKRALGTAEQMEALVGELLTISRMGGNENTACVEYVDLAELVRERLAAITDLIFAGGLQLEVSMPEHLLCPMEKLLMDKVLGNILGNGIRYTPDGGKLRVTLYKQENNVHCQVENTGIHIPEEALEHVFEPFYRVEQSRNRYTGGSGLGLYIARNILERHGAAFHIYNTAEGVMFHFSLSEERNSIEIPYSLQTEFKKA